MYTFDEFQSDVLRIAKFHGHKIERLRGTDIPQVDFGHKKLNGKHFILLFPSALAENADINKLIEEAAKGRPCTHPPFRKIVKQIMAERPEAYVEAVGNL